MLIPAMVDFGLHQQVPVPFSQGGGLSGRECDAWNEDYLTRIRECVEFEADTWRAWLFQVAGYFAPASQAHEACNLLKQIVANGLDELVFDDLEMVARYAYLCDKLGWAFNPR